MIMDPNFIVKVLLSLIVAAALAFAVTPLVKRLAQRVGAMDVPKDERRMHKIPIPRMGGLAIFFAFLIAVLCFAAFSHAVPVSASSCAADARSMSLLSVCSCAASCCFSVRFRSRLKYR